MAHRLEAEIEQEWSGAVERLAHSQATPFFAKGGDLVLAETRRRRRGKKISLEEPRLAAWWA